MQALEKRLAGPGAAGRTAPAAGSLTMRRWRAGVRPNRQHLMALLVLADDLGLGHLLTEKASQRNEYKGSPNPAGGCSSRAYSPPESLQLFGGRNPDH